MSRDDTGGDTRDDTDEDARPGAAGGERFPGFRLNHRIASGGSAVVYRAWSEARAGWVALKILKAGRWANEAQRARFRREVDVHRRIDDPGVVRFFEDDVSADGAPWFSMEYVAGPSLQQRLEDGSLPDLRRRVAWVVDLARTLARLHARGIFHRDVKPGNILLSGGIVPRLADFGIVRVVDDARRAGDVRLGTPRFMAPEVVSGDVLDWGRADLYALGLVLADLAGAEVVPPDLAAIVARATSPVPAVRQADLGALADELVRWLGT